MAKDPKIDGLLDVIRRAILDGRYLVSKHAWQRSRDRKISIGEVKFILENGWHEKRKDQWRDDHATWSYAIRGKTRDGIDGRIAVAIDRTQNETLVIVTIINLASKDDSHE